MATALITGGTSGIGAAFASQLAARGTDLVLVARDSERLVARASELHAAYGINVETISADLGASGDVARVAARLDDLDRPIDMLVSSAGAPVRTPLTSTDTALHEHAFNVMCRATFVLGAAAARSMRARSSGTIITISSLQSLLTTGSYSAIKAWVTSYSQALAVEMRGTGVTVTAVLPGWVQTEWHAAEGGRRSSIPGWLWTSAELTARIALRDAARGRVICIPTVRYRVLGWFARHLPRGVVRSISGALSSSKNASGSEPTVVEAERS